MEEKEPVRVIIRTQTSFQKLEDIKELVKALEAMQKECSCHCTLSVETGHLDLK